jgi:uncharacterized protein YkwD
MKRAVWFAMYVILAVFFTQCTGNATQPAPQPSSAPGQPRVENQTLATLTPSQEATLAASADTPTLPVVEIMATPTQPAATPTATPAQDQPTPTPTQVEPSPTPTLLPSPTPTPSTDNQTAGACEDKAAFYSDITIPDNTSFKQNEEFVKIWQIKNEGTCTWDGYQLVFGGGDNMNGPLTSPLGLVKPGELAQISVKLKAPNQGGVYTGLWEFQNKAGKRFGVNSGGVDFIWVKISVTWYPEGSSKPGVSTLPAPAGCSPQQDANVISQLLTMINKVRADKSLPPLKLDDRLSAAAQVHSVDMACKNYVDHNGSDGSTWFDRIKRQKYSYAYASENIGAADPAFGDYNWMFNWWMNSQIHRDNILSPKITQIGIGYAFYPDSDNKGYYTLDFARPSR